MLLARALVALSVVLAVAAHAAMVAGLRAVDRFLDDVAEFARDVRLETGPQATLVFDGRDAFMFSIYSHQRIDVCLDDVAPHARAAVLAAEDRRFETHPGVDLRRMIKAALVNARARRIAQGGSTITQQLVRATTLTPGRTFGRKLREIFLALEVERRFTKREILEAYLNSVYFGGGNYGIEAAARGYFEKTAGTMTPAEAALLAGAIKAPAVFAPNRDRTRVETSRNLVLRAMRDEGWLPEAAWIAARAEPLAGVRVAAAAAAEDAGAGDPPDVSGRYFREELRRELVRRFGWEQVYQGGLRVYATVDPAAQGAAERAIAVQLGALERPRARQAAGVEAEPLQGSLLAIDPKTGHVLALVGGRDFDRSEFNRATQARRQPGSAFKPLVFAAALERGFAPGSLLQGLDVPIPARDGPWLPKGDREAAEYTLRRALVVSSNRAAAQLLHRIGARHAVDLARRLGIASPLPAVPSLALGTGELTLLELTASYMAFANRGLFVPPTIIRRVEDREGRMVWEAPAGARRVLTETTAFLMSSMLQDVLDRGTGTGVRRAGFRLPAGGKTGTTNDYADAWFVGYTPRLVAGVWFGFDRPGRIRSGGLAGVIAAPAWAAFMKEATREHDPDWYETPAGVEQVTICRATGQRSVDRCRWEDWGTGAVGVVRDYFAIGDAPIESCELHGGRRGSALPIATTGVRE